MKRIFAFKTRFFVLVVGVLIAGLSSCRTSREISGERLMPLPVDQLLDAVDDNTFDYRDLTIRRINIQYASTSSKTSFRAGLKAVKDDRIVASITKMNIPVGRIMLTPDKVTFVNYIDKNFFTTNYAGLSEYIHFPVTFEVIQTMLSNKFFSSGEASESNYRSTVEGGRYLLQTLSGGNHMEKRGLFNRMRSSPFSISEPGGRGTLVEQKMYFNRRTFSLEQLMLKDAANGWKLDVNFRDFQKVDGKEYPGLIDVVMEAPDEVIELKIKFNGISTEKIEDIGLTIPERYNRIRFY